MRFCRSLPKSEVRRATGQCGGAGTLVRKWSMALNPLLERKTAGWKAALMSTSVFLPLYNWTLWTVAKVSLQAGREILPNSPTEGGITLSCNRM